MSNQDINAASIPCGSSVVVSILRPSQSDQTSDYDKPSVLIPAPSTDLPRASRGSQGGDLTAQSEISTVSQGSQRHKVIFGDTHSRYQITNADGLVAIRHMMSRESRFLPKIDTPKGDEYGDLDLYFTDSSVEAGSVAHTVSLPGDGSTVLTVDFEVGLTVDKHVWEGRIDFKDQDCKYWLGAYGARDSAWKKLSLGEQRELENPEPLHAAPPPGHFGQ